MINNYLLKDERTASETNLTVITKTHEKVRKEEKCNLKNLFFK